VLQNERTSALLDRSLEERGSSSADLLNLGLGFLRRQYLAITIATALAFVATVVFLQLGPPIYTAHAKVWLGNSKAPPIQQPSAPDETPVDLESQIKILESKAIATSVINQLRLADDRNSTVKSAGSIQSARQ
jgi:uncharacterized protein involved in exopolysaccharide biosynthesis